MTARLPTEFWLRAGVRRCLSEGIGAYVVRRGEPTGGLVLLKLNLLGPGFRVLSRTTDMEGRPAWLAAFDGATVPEADADAYIDRSIKRDPDLWVVEIEHAEGWHPFEGAVL